MKTDSKRPIKTEQKKGLNFDRHFTKKGVSPYDMFTYETRSSIIKNPSGEEIYRTDNVEVPKEWSQVATDILAQKYFRKEGVGDQGSEKSVKQVVHRLANCWKVWGERYGYFASEEDAVIFYEEAIYMMLAQMAAPNSPQWFNTGLYQSYEIKGKSQGHYYVDPSTKKLVQSDSAYEHPQPHACFILSVEDDLVNEGGIMDLFLKEARIFKYGSGTGTNFSAIRGKNEKLSGGGYSSGLMSFLRVGDRAAGAIKSGGTTRRAAKMVCVDLDHPEIMEFISWKVEEEKKVAALVASGYATDFEGEAYNTVSGQNSNNSIRVPNSFFERLKENGSWDLISRTDGSITRSLSSSEIWNAICDAAWNCADPGLQFDTIINEWHTCPEGGRIKASNPCSEYMFLDNTACNLASLNLARFYSEKTREFDVTAFEYAARLWTVILEISVLMAQFPSREVAELSYEYRTLGLGYANLGSLLMLNGIAYDSDKARGMAAAITSILTGTAYKTSSEMAQHFGAFEKYENNNAHMLKVIRNHRLAAYNVDDGYEDLSIKPQGINPEYCPNYLLEAAGKVWDEALSMGEKCGFRNAQVSCIAPTGTIGLLMDCDTTGIEPDFALVKFKKLAGGGYFRIVNKTVQKALLNLGYSKSQIKDIEHYMAGSASFSNAPVVNTSTLSSKGLTKEELLVLEKAARSAFHIRYIFNKWTLGEECLRRIGFTEEQFNSVDFDMLGLWGFTNDEINQANDHICGSMTMEGAPHLSEEHLSVFDCANKCGKSGTRFIQPFGHIKMMAAVQPFLSGAISKTINLPFESTVNDVSECYKLSWELGLKSTALYRDGSKLSQPLFNITHDRNMKKELSEDDVLEAARQIISKSADTKFKRQLSKIAHRKRLPEKRPGFTQKAKIGGQTLFVRTGEYDDGTLGEVFIDMHKEGAAFRSLLNCFAISVSIGLQYGVPLEEFVEKFVFTRFDPSGPVAHPYIKTSTSVIDYIFRLLAFEYLGRVDLLQVKPPQILNKTRSEKARLLKESFKPADQQSDPSQLYLESMMSDSPICPNCGHLTVRSGTCYKCNNCGTSLGCS